MSITCPKCNHRTLEEVRLTEHLVCENCGTEFKLVPTGKVYGEGE